MGVEGDEMTGPSIHGWVQLPPGDPGLAGVGADTSSGTTGRSFFSMDAYATPAVWVARVAAFVGVTAQPYARR